MSNSLNHFIFDQIPACIGLKNADFKYLGANKHLLAVLNSKDLDTILGLTDNELAINPPELIKLFEEQDLLALNGQSSEIIHDSDYLEGNKTFLVKKAPFRDEHNKIIGIIYNCTPWSYSTLMTSLKKLDRGLKAQSDAVDYYYLGTECHNPAKLSSRELECLFFQLRSKTAKQTATILGLSTRTVEGYLDNIKSKLGCLNKAEMLVTAMKHNYQHHIPKNLLNMNLLQFL